MEAAKTQVDFKNYLLNSMQVYLKTPIKYIIIIFSLYFYTPFPFPLPLRDLLSLILTLLFVKCLYKM